VEKSEEMTNLSLILHQKHLISKTQNLIMKSVLRILLKISNHEKYIKILNFNNLRSSGKMMQNLSDQKKKQQRLTLSVLLGKNKRREKRYKNF
jgi:hypothetical protein